MNAPRDAFARRGAGMLVDLDDPRATEPGRVGAKAAVLAQLRACGEPVPPGLVVLPGQAANGAALEVIETFGDVPLAVRSSSALEDGEQASYAGQYLTVLDVRGAAALAGAIERVRASAADPVARGYRGQAQAPMSVLVMPLIAADRAGVAFSSNPITGDDEVVIDAVIGLADRLVAGEDTPQRLVVSGDRVRAHPGGPAALDENLALEIAALAQRVARRRGRPQDIEWAVTGGSAVILQARPITALPVPPSIDVPPSQTWLREDDHYGRPLAPMELGAVARAMDAASRIVYEQIGFPAEGMQHRLIGGWPYVRMVPLMDTGKDPSAAPPGWLFGALIRIVPSLRSRLRRAAEIFGSDWAQQQAHAWGRGARTEARARIRALRERDLAALKDGELLEHLGATLDELLTACVDHTRLTSAMLMQWGRLGILCERALGWDDGRVADLLQGFSAASVAAGHELDALAKVIEDDHAARALLHSPSALLADPGPGGTALRAYLHEHGHRIVGFDLQRPTHAEDPRPLLAMVTRRIGHGAIAGRDPKRDAQKAEAEALARLVDRPAERAAFEDALHRAREARPLGDGTEEDVLLALAPLRYTALEAGRRLHEAGRLPDRDAVFMLDPEELAAALRGEPCDVDVEVRRAQMRWARAHPGPARYGPAPPPPPSLRFVPRWARPFLETMGWVMPRLAPPAVEPSSDADGLRGIPASPGRATGPVRVISTPEELHRIEPGDVLVCPMTWAEWSIAFPLLSAVVTERGGALSHPAILAREFGIPAVLSVCGATERLREGDVVVVDGTAGTVTPV